MPPSPSPPSPSLSSTSSDDSALLSALETSIDSDPSLGAYRAQRLQQLHSEHALAKSLRTEGHGTYVEIKNEKELMEKVTGTKWCVVHFFKEGFRRCEVMDGHLKTLSSHSPHIHTLFLRISVTNAPFLVTKLHIRVLPCVIAFVDSNVTEKIIGFEGLGAKGDATDDFPTKSLEARLLTAGVLSDNQTGLLLPNPNTTQDRNGDDENECDDDDDRGGARSPAASGGYLGRKVRPRANDTRRKTNDDDDEWD